MRSRVPQVRSYRPGAAAALAAAAGVAALSLAGGPAAAYGNARVVTDEKPGPVEVSVGNGGTSLREGERTRYTITLRNRTDHAVRDLTVAQMLPASLRPSGTEPEAELRPGRASWRTDVPAQGEVDLALTGEVGTIAQHEAGQTVRETEPGRAEAEGDGRGKTAVRLSTSVCVQESVRVPGGKPTARSEVDDGSGQAPSDNTVGRILTCASDADILHAARHGTPAAADGRKPWLYGSVGVGLLVLGTAAYAVHRRTRGSR